MLISSGSLNDYPILVSKKVVSILINLKSVSTSGYFRIL